jgi:hypothetical protein
MAKFKEARRQNRIQKKHRRRQRDSWDKFVTDLEHETYRTQPQVYNILKQISKDIKETAKFNET